MYGYRDKTYCDLLVNVDEIDENSAREQRRASALENINRGYTLDRSIEKRDIFLETVDFYLLLNKENQFEQVLFFQICKKYSKKRQNGMNHEQALESMSSKGLLNFYDKKGEVEVSDDVISRLAELPAEESTEEEY